MILQAISRESLIPSAPTKSDFRRCLVFFGIIFADIVAVVAIAGMYYMLRKKNWLKTDPNDERKQSNVVEFSKLVVFLIQQALFLVLIFHYVPQVRIDFQFAWLLFGVACCVICFHGLGIIVIKKMKIFPKGIFDFIQSCTYTQYLVAFLLIMYQNYKNYNSYTRYTEESKQYKESMDKNLYDLRLGFNKNEENNISKEIAIKKQISQLNYNLSAIPLFTNNLIPQVMDVQSKAQSVLNNTSGLLNALQLQSEGATSSNLSNQKLAFYNANPLYYSDYLSYINKSNKNNALNQISYFLSSFSQSEIVALAKLQNSQIASLLQDFLQLQGITGSVQNYTSQTNTNGLFDYLKTQNPVSYSNKLSTKIDCNILFSVNDEKSSESIILRDNLDSFLACNSFSLVGNNIFDYVVRGGQNCGLGANVGGDFYFLCLQVNGLYYGFIFYKNNMMLVFAENGWALSYGNYLDQAKTGIPTSPPLTYFQIFNLIDSSFTTSSPINFSDNNAFYALEEDFSFSQGMKTDSIPVSSSYVFRTPLDDVTYSEPTFTLQKSWITMSLKGGINIMSQGRSTAPTQISFSNGAFSVTVNGNTLNGNYYPISF